MRGSAVPRSPVINGYDVLMVLAIRSPPAVTETSSGALNDAEDNYLQVSHVKNRTEQGKRCTMTFLIRS